MQDEVKVSHWRKKPVVITAVQINTQEDAERCPGICTGGLSCKSKGAPDGAWPHIHTLEGDHTWTPGDWCITGVKGERYFCKPDIFEQTYEPATDQAERDTLARMEPVAWMYEREGSSAHVSLARVKSTRDAFWGWTETPLYALPPAPEAGQ